MKILVVGRGWTGNKIYRELLARDHQVSMIDHRSVFDLVKNENFDWVVNCAGITGYPNVDACEKDPMGTMEGNAVFPVLLHKVCAQHAIKFAHFSSGCIYHGVITDVMAAPNFFGSVYSISKGLSDNYLKDKALVFRIRMPFTNIIEQKNLLTKLRTYAVKGKLAHLGPNSLSDHDEVVRVACDLIEEDITVGAFNLVNQGSVTNKELADMLGLQHAEWFTDEEFQKFTAAARSNCVVPADPRMRDLKEALAQAIATYH